MKRAWHKFLSTASFHGFPRIATTSSRLVQLVWIVFIVLSGAVGFINIVQTVNDFYQFDVITNVDRISAKSLTFPAITICTKGHSRMFHFNKTDREYYIIFNLTLEFFLRDLEFRAESFNRTEMQFFKIPKSLGDCIRFNGFANKSLASAEAKSDALRLRLIPSHTQFISSTEAINYYSYKEMDIYITDNYLNSYLGIDPIITLENLSKDHFIDIKKTETETKLGEPYSECTAQSDLTYRQKNCIEQCINRGIKSNYNCSIPSYYRISGLEECGGELQFYRKIDSTSDQWSSEYFDTHIDFVQRLVSQFDTECESECAMECESVQFSVTISTITSNKPTFQFSINDFSTLAIRQIPKMNSFLLVSNVGGSLGLFFGISFLSFVEILEFLIELVVIILIH